MERQTGKRQTSSKNSMRLSTTHPIVDTDGGGFDRRKSFDTRRCMGRSAGSGSMEDSKFVVWPNAGKGIRIFVSWDGVGVVPTEHESPSPTGRTCMKCHQKKWECDELELILL